MSMISAFKIRLPGNFLYSGTIRFYSFQQRNNFIKISVIEINLN